MPTYFFAEKEAEKNSQEVKQEVRELKRAAETP
jgi:hypothetical protein